MQAQEILDEIKKLDSSEKIMLVEDVWDSLRDDSQALPVPEWHVMETEKRYGDYKAGKLELYDWEDVHREIRRCLK